MATHSARFLEGYLEVPETIVNSGKETVRWQKNGDIYTMDVSLKHDKRDGVANIIGCDGTTMETVTYKKGRLNGICKHYYGSGSIKMKCMVVDDRMEGKFTEYDGSGKVICRGRYVDGERKEDELDGEEAHEDESGDEEAHEDESGDEEAHEDEPQSSSGFGKAFAGGTAAAAGTAAATGAFGGAAALLGFGSPGIAAGSAAASIMSAAWTTGIGTGLVSAAQSAGALFMAAAGGSTLVAGAAVAAPLAVGTAVAGGIYYWRNRKNGGNKDKDKEEKDTEEKDTEEKDKEE